MTTDDLDVLHATRSLLSSAAGRLDNIAFLLQETGSDRLALKVARISNDLHEAAERLDQTTGSIVTGQMRAATESSTNLLNAALAGVLLGVKGE